MNQTPHSHTPFEYGPFEYYTLTNVLLPCPPTTALNSMISISTYFALLNDVIFRTYYFIF